MNYSDCLIWQRPTAITKSPSTGFEQCQYADDHAGDTLYCAVLPLLNQSKQALGLTVDDVLVNVRVNNRPDITKRDRLIDEVRECIYKIKQIQKRPNELIILCEVSEGL